MLFRRTQLVPISVIKTIDANAMFARGEKVLIAFSGGSDSTALVHILLLQSERYGIRLHLAYLNHNLRGDESQAEQRFVEDTAERLGLPLELRVLTEDEAEVISARSTEAHARAIRLQFLEDTAEKVGAEKIATGHTFNDHVETLIMRLFTGTGPDGFAGIKPVSGMFVRPLIETPKDALLGFLSDNSIGYIQDSTNSSCEFLRNRVRRHLIPKIIEAFGPHAPLKLASFSKIIAAEGEIVEEIAVAAYREARRRVDERSALDVEALKRLKPAVRNRVLRLALSDMKFPHQSISSRHLASIAAIATSRNPEARTKLPGGVTVGRKGDIIVFGAPDARQDTCPSFKRELTVPGEVPIPFRNLIVSAKIVNAPAHAIPSSKAEAMLDADVCLKCGDSLIVRSLEQRDAFIPLGMKQRVPVIDFLKKSGVHRYERLNHPLLTREDGKVLWVVGERIDDEARISKSTRSGVLLSLRPV